jgi:DNA-directed RNA polymerase specialized sigma24 family protein
VHENLCLRAWGAGKRARAMNVDDSRLSQITTRWSVIFEACHGPDHADQAAQAQVLERYCGAIYRYAVRVLGDPDLADEACQEFAFRFVRGDFRHADPAKGRFRDYAKTAVIHLLREFHRDRIARARITSLESETAKAPATPTPIDVHEAEFMALWRKELINRAWDEMELQQRATGPPYFRALWLKAQEPLISAVDLAERLRTLNNGDYSAAGVRQVLHRAREIFAEKLLEEVSRSILSDDYDSLAEELAELDLLTYCRQALTHRRG